MQDPDANGKGGETRRDTKKIDREELQRLIRKTQSPPLVPWHEDGSRVVIEDDGEIA